MALTPEQDAAARENIANWLRTIADAVAARTVTDVRLNWTHAANRIPDEHGQITEVPNGEHFMVLQWRNPQDEQRARDWLQQRYRPAAGIVLPGTPGFRPPAPNGHN